MPLRAPSTAPVTGASTTLTLTSVGSYCVVFDTVVEDMPADAFPDRPWGKGDNPKTAVWQYLKGHPEFEIDRAMDSKLLISVAPDGYLKRVPAANKVYWGGAVFNPYVFGHLIDKVSPIYRRRISECRFYVSHGISMA